MGCQDTLVIDAVKREAGVGESGEAVPVQPGSQRHVLWGRWKWRERKGKGNQYQHFHTPSFCTCCFLRLACPAFSPTSSFMNVLKHQPPLIRSPSFPGGRSKGREMQKGTKLMAVFSAPPPHVTPTSSRCVHIPHQTVNSRRTGAEPVLDTFISCSQQRMLHHEGLSVRRMHGWREYSTSFVKRVGCLDPSPSPATHHLCDLKQVTQSL